MDQLNELKAIVQAGQGQDTVAVSVATLEATLKQATETAAVLERAIGFLVNVPADYRNGNAAFGVDEGEVMATQFVNRLVDDAKAVGVGLEWHRMEGD